ncbi:MAG: sugar phosphate isomerase/epimerase [Candidatus Hydrogenedentes bacterium]|nr:sugar phosphate isomerase/epimerase [Candidatus Hydrogenedentota bacterium]
MKIEQLAINSVSNLPHGLEANLDAYAAAGFKNVEFYLKHVWDYIKKGHSPKDVRAMLDARGLKCIGGFETIVKCFAPDDVRRKNHATVRQNAELLKELGGSILVVGTDGPNPAQRKAGDPIKAMAQAFNDVARSIERTGVTLCIEFNWSPYVKSLRTACEIARLSRRKNVGVLFDPAHYHCTPTKMEHIDGASVPFIRYVHVNDMRNKPGELSDCNADRALPGKGCLPLRELFGRIEQHGYRGYFSIEMFDQELWNMPPMKSARIMYDSVVQLCSS